MSNGAQHAAGPATYRMLRELGSRTQRSYAAVREPDELLVAQRFVRVSALGDPAPAGADEATPLDAEAMALLLRDARCLAKNPHPNLARVLHAEVSPAPRRELTVATELLDGATLADLLDAARRARIAPLLIVRMTARVLLDVLAGLGALHALRDAIGLPLGAVHGELCPANVVVGNDGVTRIVDALRRRPVSVVSTSEAAAYAAPEALTSSGTSDPRADLHAVGAILNESLVGSSPSAFPRLAQVATRALSFEPALRFDDAAEMARELEASAEGELSSRDDVAALVMELAGARIRSRRGTLVPATSGTRRRASSLSFGDESDDLPGPRASSPEGPLDRERVVSNTSGAKSARRIVVTRAALEAISPLTPTVPLAATPEPSPLPPRTTAPARAPSVPAFPASGTPGDFVIPIEVTETLNEAAPRRRTRRVAVFAVAAAVLAIATYVGIRPAFRAASPPSVVAAPPPLEAAPLPPPAAPTAERVAAIATTPAARASATTSAGARRVAPPLPAPAAPPPKPKRSVYEPDSL